MEHHSQGGDEPDTVELYANCLANWRHYNWRCILKDSKVELVRQSLSYMAWPTYITNSESVCM